MNSKNGSQKTVPLSREGADQLRQNAAADQAVTLLIYHRNGALAVPLHSSATVVIGREPPSDIVVADSSLSRQHARFGLKGGSLIVEDLKSTNGTFVRGQRVKRTTVHPSEQILVGTVMVSPHVHAKNEVPSCRLGNHDRFGDALADELCRAKFFKRTCGVALVRSASREAHKAHVDHWFGAVKELLRPVDRAALYSSGAVELLLSEMTGEQARAKADEIARCCDAVLVCGVGSYPECATSQERLIDVVRRACQQGSASDPVIMAPSMASRSLFSEADPQAAAGAPIAESPAMKRVFSMVDRLANSSIPVLLLGETGTGKEVVSQAIHERGPRRSESLVCVNCGAIPSQLLESTLFGHVRGAFTGAHQASKGVFGSADGGTVLLDEVGELPAAAQAALLRVIETKRVTPVGSSDERAVDVRVLAATHRDLEAMVGEGVFREDLLYRLNAMTLSLPPLRERKTDLRPLVRRFLAEANRTNERDLTIDDEALGLLEEHRWPGNLRELKNAMERAAVIAVGDSICVEDLPERVRDGSSTRANPSQAAAESKTPPANESPQELGPNVEFKAQVQQFEAQLIITTLETCQGNQTEAARSLKMPLRTLVHKMKSYGIKKGYGVV